MSFYAFGLNAIGQTIHSATGHCDLSSFSISNPTRLNHTSAVLHASHSCTLVLTESRKFQCWGVPPSHLNPTPSGTSVKRTSVATAAGVKKFIGPLLQYLLTTEGQLGDLLSIDNQQVEYRRIIPAESDSSEACSLCDANSNILFVDAAASDTQLAAITQSGSLFVWDFSVCLSPKPRSEPEPEHESDSEYKKSISYCVHNLNLVSIEAGKHHFVARSECGDVYSWSPLVMYSECGHGSMNLITRPKRIQALAGINIASIACGYFHSAFVSSTGDLYTCGFNKFYQLGRGSLGSSSNHIYEAEASGSDAEDYSIPEPVSLFLQQDGISRVEPTVFSAHCGMYHTVVSTDLGVFSCGWGKYGQLGYKLVSERNQGGRYKNGYSYRTEYCQPIFRKVEVEEDHLESGGITRQKHIVVGPLNTFVSYQTKDG